MCTKHGGKGKGLCCITCVCVSQTSTRSVLQFLVKIRRSNSDISWDSSLDQQTHRKDNSTTVLKIGLWRQFTSATVTFQASLDGNGAAVIVLVSPLLPTRSIAVAMDTWCVAMRGYVIG